MSSAEVGNKRTWQDVQERFREIGAKIEEMRRLVKGLTLTPEELMSIDFALIRLRTHSEQVCEAIGERLMKVK